MFIIAPYCQIMTQLDLKDSSRNLHIICVIVFFSLHLILNTCVETFDDSVKIFVLGTTQGLNIASNKNAV